MWTQASHFKLLFPVPSHGVERRWDKQDGIGGDCPWSPGLSRSLDGWEGVKIWIIDPWLTIERRLWIEGWARYSRHQIFAFAFPPSFQMPSGTPSPIARERARRLARRIRRYLTGSATRDPSRQPAGLPDLVLLTDGLDGLALVEEVGDLLTGVPFWIYWHRSAMACPKTSTLEEIAIELRTTRIVERCVFHGEGQRQHFLRALAQHELKLALKVEKHATVLPPGFEPFPLPSEDPFFREPVVLWILRGELEEIPLLIATLDHPAFRSQNFRVLLLSERPEREATRMQRLPPGLRARILGILNPETHEARRWTSVAQAVVEGSICLHSPIHLMRLAFEGPWPLAPAGSGLLEAFPEALRPRYAYHSPEELAERLTALLRGSPQASQEIRQALIAWTWPSLAPRYDDLCETALDNG